MPTYEYACKSGGDPCEVVQSVSDDPLTTCTDCGGQLRKVFGSIGISFKGSGFYRTDSRPAATKGDHEKEKAKETSGANADAGSKESSSGGDGASSSKTASPSKSGSSSASTSPKKSDSTASKPGGGDKAGAAATAG